MSDNPLSPQQKAELASAKLKLTALDKEIVNMERALIPVPVSVKEMHNELKKKIDALILVYGK